MTTGLESWWVPSAPDTHNVPAYRIIVVEPDWRIWQSYSMLNDVNMKLQGSYNTPFQVLDKINSVKLKLSYAERKQKKLSVIKRQEQEEERQEEKREEEKTKKREKRESKKNIEGAEEEDRTEGEEEEMEGWTARGGEGEAKGYGRQKREKDKRREKKKKEKKIE
ncbi:hypothetical protein LSTR_LSTR017689 [Laodelphax striatellus]|uniref:Uncharacterized protein n=1 Tax=Laodelphax striatellus TaxID=195883 RepID=A0A482WTK3_LAOST|nr:hypothetical protein LSTR_LSTR017689 [Laodelphax striatellus]